MSERIIAIGDIHGCSAALDVLLDAIDPTPDDLVITLGDYVDRGPDSKGVIDRLIELRKQTRLVALLGNHEEMMLEVARGDASHVEWCRHGGMDTLDSYGWAGEPQFLPDEHLEFLEGLGDFFETSSHIFTHAAYDAALPMEEQPIEMLRWESLYKQIPPPHYSGKMAVVGHTAMRDGDVKDYGHLIMLDTHAYGDGWLTAMDVHKRWIWQANKQGVLRD